MDTQAHKRLSDTLEDRNGWDFEWGLHDCVMFAFDVLSSAYNTNYIDHIIRRYESPLGGLRFVNEYYDYGPSSVVEGIRCIAEENDFERVEPPYTKTGDLAVAKIDPREGAGIVVDARVVVPAYSGGWERISRKRITEAYRPPELKK